MNININTDKVMSWIRFHLRNLIPFMLIFFSWFGVHCIDFSAGGTPTNIWWGFASVLLGTAGIFTLIVLLTIIYDEKNK